MPLKAYNNGVNAKEIRCIDAGGVERIIREIRKGDVQWWLGEFDPPTIQGTWTKVSDGLYQTKAVIPSYTTPSFLESGHDTNYVIVSFHSYENYVTCEFFGDFENLTIHNSDDSNGLSGEFYVTYSWDDASGNGEQLIKCNLNVFPKSNGMVTECQYRLEVDPEGSFVEDSSFVDSYGSGWVVQGTEAHNKMCSDAYGYYSETTADPWGPDGRSDYTWYNWTEIATGVTNYICANNGRAFSVQPLSGSVSVKFCPPGGNESGWTESSDSVRFPSADGWYQKTKKDGYTKYFNVSTGRFAEYLPKEMIRTDVMTRVRNCIGTHLADSEYDDRVVCTAYNNISLTAESKLAERKTNNSLTSPYDSEFWFDLYNIPLVNLSTGDWIFGHYNPSVPFGSPTDNGTTWSYIFIGDNFYDVLITMTFSTGDCTMTLQLNDDWGFADNTFLTGTFPKANYKYVISNDTDLYSALIIVCVANYKTDVVGDFHEYRLPVGATYELKSVSISVNGTTTAYAPGSGYVKGTVRYTDSDGSYVFVIRPYTLIGSFYHRIVFNYSAAVGTTKNSKNLEISSNLAYFGTPTYLTPQNSIDEAKRVIPLYWRLYAYPGDRANQSLDGTRYLTSCDIQVPLNATIDWDESHETYVDEQWSAYYVLPINTASPLTIAKSKFMYAAPNEYSDLPGFGSLDGSDLESTITDSSAILTNGTLTITMNRATGDVSITSTAKNNIPGYTSNPANFVFYYSGGLRRIYWKDLTTNDQGIIDMATGTLS